MALELKKQLYSLIENEQDQNVLKAIRTLLKKTQLDPVLREKLTARALRAEEDIAAGRLYTREQVEKMTDPRRRK